MATNDEAGAVAAAQYFITDLYDYMFASGDTVEWSTLADDGCNFCNAILTKSQEMVSAQQLGEADPSAVVSTEAVTLIEGSRYAVTLVLDQGASRIVDRSGSVVGESPAGRFSVNYAIAWTGDWSILAVDATPLPEDGS